MSGRVFSVISSLDATEAAKGTPEYRPEPYKW